MRPMARTFRTFLDPHAPAWPPIIVAAGFLTLWFTAADIAVPIRPFVAAAFLFLGPGIAFVRAIGVRDPLLAPSLAVSVSLAADLLVATAVTYATGFHAALMVALLVLLTLGALVAEARPWRS
jgi:hypothetical protein